MIRILESKQVGRLFARRAARLGEAEAVVRPILEAVRKRGDRALLEYARRFDGLERKSVRVPPRALAAAASALSSGFGEEVRGGRATFADFLRFRWPLRRFGLVRPAFRLGRFSGRPDPAPP